MDDFFFREIFSTADGYGIGIFPSLRKSPASQFLRQCFRVLCTAFEAGIFESLLCSRIMLPAAGIPAARHIRSQDLF